jgi:hypothetical protein
MKRLYHISGSKKRSIVILGVRSSGKSSVNNVQFSNANEVQFDENHSHNPVCGEHSHKVKFRNVIFPNLPVYRRFSPFKVLNNTCFLLRETTSRIILAKLNDGGDTIFGSSTQY